MRQFLCGLLATAWLLGAGASPLAAQALGGNALLSARDAVQAEIAESLPRELPPGPIAILPPKVEPGVRVDPEVAGSWGVAMAETLHRLRPAMVQTSREHLTDILREQKFGDSAYADPATAARVGQLVAARTLLLTRIREFHLENGRIRVAIDASLVDVETGKDLWSKAYHRGIFPFWAKVVLAVMAVLLGMAIVGAWLRKIRTKLVNVTLPRAKAEARIDLDGVGRSVVDARERFRRAGELKGAEVVQAAWVDLDAVFDRVRHALPGGAVDRSRVRDLNGAVRESERIEALLGDVRRECDRAGSGSSDAQALAGRLRGAASDLRTLVDDYRKYLI